MRPEEKRAIIGYLGYLLSFVGGGLFMLSLAISYQVIQCSTIPWGRGELLLFIGSFIALLLGLVLIHIGEAGEAPVNELPLKE